MAETEVKWLKMKVGMFDGNSFKKIKRAKIGGVSYRDKLTAVWFELLDLAGKSNCNGLLVDNNEIPYETYEDIAVMLDREEKEIELCMQFFISEQMVEVVNKIYCITKFVEYQNTDGLEKIKEQKRLAQQRWRERKKLGLIGQNVDKNNLLVDTTVDTTDHLPSISNSTSTSNIYENYNFSDKVKDSIDLWLSYKKERKQTYKDTGLNVLLDRLQKDYDTYGEQYVIDSIESSIASNYQGIYAPKNVRQPNAFENSHHYSKEQLNSLVDNIDDIDFN